MNPMVLAANQDDGALALAFVPLILFGILYLALIVAVFWVYGKIVSRSGYSWTWIFAMLVPGLNIVMLCMFAFKEWPIQRELALTRQALQAATGSPYPQGGHPGHAGPYGGQPPYGTSAYQGQAVQQYAAPPQNNQQGGYGQPPTTNPYGNSY